jgi:predicted DCC family thiol-disulfide oxidoreductase YuxK
VPSFPDDKPIIVFDGMCVICSGWAQFVIRHDRDKRFRLLAAQTLLGAALYAHYGLDSADYETNLLIETAKYG